MPLQIDQIILPRWMITVSDSQDAATVVLENYGIAIDQGEILDIQQQEVLCAKYQATHLDKRPSHVLIPGLVNAHTHSAMSLLRGYADDLPLMEWLTHHIWPIEAKHVNEDFISVGTDLAMAEMLKSGTTCFNDMYFFADVTAKRVEAAGMRACLGMIVLDFPSVWAENADEYLSKGLHLKDRLRHSTLIHCAFAPHTPYTVSDEPLKHIATLAEELDCPIHMHIHETAHEVEESMARHGMRPLERLERLGLLGPQLIAVHMTQLLTREIEMLARYNVNIVHCPESNLKLASGFCPVHQLQKMGLNVALGTDSAASNNDLSMLGEMNTASLLAKGVSEDPTALSAYETLKCATINGAKTLGLEKTIGSLEIGKQADMVAVDLNGYNTEPIYQPLNQLVYSASSEQVSDVWVAGKALLYQGQLMTIDPEATLIKARKWQKKIA